MLSHLSSYPLAFCPPYLTRDRRLWIGVLAHIARFADTRLPFMYCARSSLRLVCYPLHTLFGTFSYLASCAMNPGERDPLLQVHSVQARSTTEVVATVNQGEDPSKYGPMDISRTTRYGILAGIWAATFLSVRSIKWIAHMTCVCSTVDCPPWCWVTYFLKSLNCMFISFHRILSSLIHSFQRL